MAEEIVNLTQKIASEELNHLEEFADQSIRNSGADILHNRDVRTRLIAYVMAREENMYTTVVAEDTSQLDSTFLTAVAEHRARIRDRLQEGIAQLQADSDGDLKNHRLINSPPGEQRTGDRRKHERRQSEHPESRDRQGKDRKGHVSHWFG